MKDKLLIFGGVNSDVVTPGEAWSAYKAGRIIELDLASGEVVERVYCNASPPWVSPERKIGMVFKSSHVESDRVLACTTTEILEYSLPSWRLTRSTSCPKLNDVHHVMPGKNDSVLVVSTGLDALLRLDWHGSILESWSLVDHENSMLTDDIDYRDVETTKPHAVHPNFVFFVGERMYVTRFKQMDALCVNDTSAPILSVSRGNIHDGLVRGTNTWFTVTSGWLCAVDNQTGKETFALDINQLTDDQRPLGWCRGVEFLDDDTAIVGFSRLRTTKIKENIKWVVAKFSNKQESPRPTRILVLDLKNRRLIREIGLEGEIEMNAVFSLSLLR